MSDSAVFAWAGLVVLVFVYVLSYDLWAHYTGHLTMTAQFQRWLHEPVWGPIMAGIYVAIPVGLAWHFLVKASS